MFARRLRNLLYPLFACVGLMIVALACNLSSESRPPTIVPQLPSPTPPPTIGYATLEPDELPDEATIVTPNRDETVLLNLTNQVQQDRLFMHVSRLQGFGSRHFGSTQADPNFGIGAAANYIQQEFNAIRDQSQGRFSVTTQPFDFTYNGQGHTGQNVIGILSGYEAGAGVIVVGAHYDSISVERDNPNAPSPGANDNATGVAALLEIARIMSQRQPRATVIFVAFGVEEINRVGSIAFVNNYIVGNNIDVYGMINMDIIGSSTGSNGATIDDRIRMFSAEPNESGSRNLARAINLIALRLIPMMSITVEATGDREGRYSDHLSFSDVGISSVRFIEYLEDANRNHTDRDTLDTVRSSYLTRATQTVLGVTTSLADGPRPPRSISLRDLGNGNRQLVWETTPGAVSYTVALRQPGSLVYNYYFDINSNSVEWDGFTSNRWEAVAIAARDENGLIGPMSAEFFIEN